jgi:hypothetical protein
MAAPVQRVGDVGGATLGHLGFDQLISAPIFRVCEGSLSDMYNYNILFKV